MGVEFFHTDREINGQTDMKNPAVTFRDFANAPKTAYDMKRQENEKKNAACVRVKVMGQ